MILPITRWSGGQKRSRKEAPPRRTCSNCLFLGAKCFAIFYRKFLLRNYKKIFGPSQTDIHSSHFWASRSSRVKNSSESQAAVSYFLKNTPTQWFGNSVWLHLSFVLVWTQKTASLLSFTIPGDQMFVSRKFAAAMWEAQAPRKVKTPWQPQSSPTFVSSTHFSLFLDTSGAARRAPLASNNRSPSKTHNLWEDGISP